MLRGIQNVHENSFEWQSSVDIYRRPLLTNKTLNGTVGSCVEGLLETNVDARTYPQKNPNFNRRGIRVEETHSQ
jgi:hypothetical protein